MDETNKTHAWFRSIIIEDESKELLSLQTPHSNSLLQQPQETLGSSDSEDGLEENSTFTSNSTFSSNPSSETEEPSVSCGCCSHNLLCGVCEDSNPLDSILTTPESSITFKCCKRNCFERGGD